MTLRSLRYISVVLACVICSASYSQSVSIDSVTATLPSCGTADGELLIHASGGSTQLIFSIDSNATNQSDSLFINLSPGEYDIYVSDSNGFFDTLTYTLYGTGGITVNTANTTDVLCFGYSDGTVDVQASGGTGNLTYVLNGTLSQSTGLFMGLSAGNHEVVIMDDAFCVDTLLFTINEPAEVVLSYTSTDASCPATDGTVTLNGSGGDGTYQYSMDGGVSYQSNPSYANLASGSYQAIVVDGNGCADTATVIINSASGTGPNIVTMNFINPLCNGSNNGSITVFAIGTNPMTYSIDGGTTFSPANTFTGLAPGEYVVMVQDGNGCQSGNIITITEPSVLQTTINALDETCVGGNGQINFSTTGGVQSYQYSIDSGATYSGNANNSGLSGGTYYWFVEDNNGCYDSGLVVLNTGGGPTIDSLVIQQPTCPLDSDGLIHIYASSQNGPIQYSIDGGNIFFPTDSFPDLPAGTYDIILIDGDNCVTSQQVVLSGPTTPVADFSADVTTGIIPQTVNFTDNSIGGTGYSWDFGDSGSSSSQNPSHTYTAAGTFTVVQTVTDGVCTDTATIVINILGEPSVTVPNVFTPNGDGINDFFYPQTIGITTLQGTIFNRYGAMVYQWEGINGGWDGHTYPSGLMVAEGTYYYVIDAVAIDGTEIRQAGHLTLLRQAVIQNQ